MIPQEQIKRKEEKQRNAETAKKTVLEFSVSSCIMIQRKHADVPA